MLIGLQVSGLKSSVLMRCQGLEVCGPWIYDSGFRIGIRA